MTAPVRVQLSRRAGWRMPESTVKVDRSTRFGNPFVCTRPYGCPKSPLYDHGEEEDGTPSMYCCVDTYRLWVEQGIRGEPSTLIGAGGGLTAGVMAERGNVERTKLVTGLPKLRGKNLACWCAIDAPCHADVLLDLANRRVCEQVPA